MAQIQVANLTFCYEGSYDNIFEHTSFQIDTNWKLGFIGRNGKGKTTFANLLLGKHEYKGTIAASGVNFDYFPYQADESDFNKTASELLVKWKCSSEEWRVICELQKLDVDAEILYRPFGTLSHGEQVKVMLAVLFSGDNDFTVIDEPTNHLDFGARQTVKRYLQKKKGFILISHDRDLLDDVVDHILALNRKSIEIQTGNFSSWWENKERKDKFAEAENEKHLSEIAALKRAADQSARWAEKNESTKIGFDPRKEPDRCKGTRPYIGAKTKKMEARVKSYQVRLEREIQEKEGLLADIEKPAALKLMPQKYFKDTLVCARDYSFRFADSDSPLISNFNFSLKQGERIFLHGRNGCGKSTLIKQILAAAERGSQPVHTEEKPGGLPVVSGELKVGSGLAISYINQDTAFLHGTIRGYCRENGFDESLMLAILRQLDMERVQFEKPMESYSEGQKKKVLIAASLLTPAHLYIWDEPLNYIDVFSRMQIEELILRFRPTMLIVDHDVRFRDKVATGIVEHFRL